MIGKDIMGVTLQLLDERGLMLATLDGVVTRVDHHAAMDKVRALAERGDLRALLIDGRSVDVAREASFRAEMWEEIMAAIGPCSVAYIPPDSFTPAREAVVRRAAEEWDCIVAFHPTMEAATGWCLDQMTV